MTLRPLARAAALALVSSCTLGHPASLYTSAGTSSPPLVLNDVRWLGDAQEGLWKVAETVENDGTTPTGASITCALVDASGVTSASASGTMPYLDPGKRRGTFVVVTGFKTEPASADCTVAARPPVAPKPKPPAQPTLYPSAIAFFDTRHAVLVGQMATRRCFNHTSCPGVIETSADGGESWEVVANFPQVVGWVTTREGYAWATLAQCSPEDCRSSALLRSADFGRTWKKVSSVNVYQPSFATPSIGWGLGRGTFSEGSMIARTANGGHAWTIAPGPCPRGARIAANISVLSASHVVVTCTWGDSATDMEGKAIESTTDGGHTWQMLARVGVPDLASSSGGLPITGYLPGTVFLPDGNGWMWLDRGYFYATQDAGASWHRSGNVLKPDVNHMASAWFLSPKKGFALLWQGRWRLIRTDDGGHAWSTITTWPDLS